MLVNWSGIVEIEYLLCCDRVMFYLVGRDQSLSGKVKGIYLVCRWIPLGAGRRRVAVQRPSAGWYVCVGAGDGR